MLRVFFAIAVFLNIGLAEYQALQLESQEWRLHGNVGNTPLDGLAVFKNGQFRILLGCSPITGTYYRGSNFIIVDHVDAAPNPCNDALIASAQADLMRLFFGKLEMSDSLGLIVLQRRGVSLELRAQDPYEGGRWERKWNWWEKGYYTKKELDRQKEAQRQYRENQYRQQLERRDQRLQQQRQQNRNPY